MKKTQNLKHILILIEKKDGRPHQKKCSWMKKRKLQHQYLNDKKIKGTIMSDYLLKSLLLVFY